MQIPVLKKNILYLDGHNKIDLNNCFLPDLVENIGAPSYRVIDPERIFYHFYDCLGYEHILAICLRFNPLQVLCSLNFSFPDQIPEQKLIGNIGFIRDDILITPEDRIKIKVLQPNAVYIFDDLDQQSFIRFFSLKHIITANNPICSKLMGYLLLAGKNTFIDPVRPEVLC